LPTVAPLEVRWMAGRPRTENRFLPILAHGFLLLTFSCIYVDLAPSGLLGDFPFGITHIIMNNQIIPPFLLTATIKTACRYPPSFQRADPGGTHE